MKKDGHSTLQETCLCYLNLMILQVNFNLSLDFFKHEQELHRQTEVLLHIGPR